MLNTWMSAAEQLLYNLVGNPASKSDFLILLGVALVAVFIGMWLLEMAFGLGAASPARRLLGVVLVSVTGLLGATAGTLYLRPMATDSLVQVVLIVSAGVIAILLIALPLYKLLLHTSYVKVLACVVGGFFMAAICIPLVISAMDGVKRAAKNVQRGSDRADAVDKAVGGKL